MKTNKELFVVLGEDHYKESGCFEAFKTKEEADEWNHCGPVVHYVNTEKLETLMKFVERFTVDDDAGVEWFARRVKEIIKDD